MCNLINKRLFKHIKMTSLNFIGLHSLRGIIFPSFFQRNIFRMDKSVFSLKKQNFPRIGFELIDGPVDEDVMIVDSAGNTIPVKGGNLLTGSKDGKWIQERQPAKDPKGVATGLRKDGGGHPQGLKHLDPRSRKPHGHVPGVTNPDGTPWLPIY